MQKVVLGERTDRPAFYDMTGLYPANKLVAGFLRIGDRAAAYIQLSEWRERHPNRRLVVLDQPEASHNMLTPNIGREVSADWMVGDLADEIWLMDKPDDLLEGPPPGEAINDIPLWTFWKHFTDRKGNKAIRPKIRPKKESLEKCREIRKYLKIPKRYMTVHPYFDAKYAQFRNVPPVFWYNFIQKLQKEVPVVVIGPYSSAGAMPVPTGAYPVWALDMSIMDSLAMVYEADVHVGGETGTTIWSCVFGTDTFGVYANVVYEDVWFAEPIPFSGRVRVNRSLDPDLTAADALQFWLTKA